MSGKKSADYEGRVKFGISVGGYNKSDVNSYIVRTDEAHYEEMMRLRAEYEEAGRELRGEIERLSAELSVCRERGAELESELSDWKSRSASCAAREAFLSGENTSLRRKNEELTALVNELRRQTEEARDNAERLEEVRAQLEEAQKQLEEKTAPLDDVCTEVPEEREDTAPVPAPAGFDEQNAAAECDARVRDTVRESVLNALSEIYRMIESAGTGADKPETMKLSGVCSAPASLPSSSGVRETTDTISSEEGKTERNSRKKYRSITERLRPRGKK